MSKTGRVAGASEPMRDENATRVATMSRRVAWLAWSLWLLGIVIDFLARLLEGLSGHVVSPPIAGDLVFIATLTVGALIVSRRRANRIGWLLLLTALLLVFGGFGTLADQYAIYTFVTRPGALPAGEWVLWLGGIAQPVGFLAIVLLLLLLYPDGYPLSPRWGLVVWLTAVYIALTAVAVAITPTLSGAADLHIPNPLGIVSIGGLAGLWDAFSLIAGIGLLLASIASVFLRFRRARGDERQQLKWFAFGALLIPLGGLILLIGVLLNLPWMINLPLWQLSTAGIPIATGIAILKYHLYDIDLIIRRTLIYGALTATLAFLYLGSVALLEQLLRAVTGQQQSTIVTVLSTLAIAALSAPLRRAIQSVIDRRFYQRKYDSAQVLAALGATVRDEVDLNKLTEELLAIVTETMQPVSVSLWLTEVGTSQPAPAERLR
jgi:hypothetical protein